MSSSNPSRIPFEMMAAGLPVVDLYRENNLYDIPDDGVLLADTSPEAVATAIIKLLDDEKLRNKLGKAGYEYMQKYPIERGFDEFLKFVNDMLNDVNVPDGNVTKIYKREPVLPSQEVINVMDAIKEVPVAPKDSSNFVRKLVVIKRYIRRKYASIIHKIFRV